MAAIKGKDTVPEMVVRCLLHAAGYRYRLHAKNLPGKPDLVFPARRKVVEVRGCFWHGHGCSVGHSSRSRQDYWSPKILGNRARDERNMKMLSESGWSVFEAWECQVRKEPQRLVDLLRAFLGPSVRTEPTDSQG